MISPAVGLLVLAAAVPAPPSAPSLPSPAQCVRAAHAALSKEGRIAPTVGAAAYASMRACMRALLESGDEAGAAEVAFEANALFPAEPQSGYDYAAVLLLTRGDTGTARAVLEDSLKRTGRFTTPSARESALALNNLGKIALDRGETVIARQRFGQAMKLDSSYPGLLFNLAAADRQAGDAAAGIEHSEAAFSRAPAAASRDDYRNLSWAYAQKGRERDAADALRRGIAALPNETDLHLDLGRALDRQGRSLDALLEYFYEFMNDPAGASAAKESRAVFEAGTIAPTSPAEPLRWLKSAGSDDPKEALESLARLDGAGHKHIVLDLLKAQALYRAGRMEEASAALRSCIADDPAFLPAYLDLAALLRDSGNDLEARRFVAEAARRNPAHWQLIGER